MRAVNEPGLGTSHWPSYRCIRGTGPESAVGGPRVVGAPSQRGLRGRPSQVWFHADGDPYDAAMTSTATRTIAIETPSDGSVLVVSERLPACPVWA